MRFNDKFNHRILIVIAKNRTIKTFCRANEGLSSLKGAMQSHLEVLTRGESSLSEVGLTMSENGKKCACFICGFRTMDERCEWEICPVRFWEDDLLVAMVDRTSPANDIMMESTAQAKLIRHGAVRPEFVRNVRPPNPGEEKDRSWKPLAKAFKIFQGLETVPGPVVGSR